MDYFAGIDGTGPYNYAQYDRAMGGSFVGQLARDSRFKARTYERGPSMEGATAKLISQRVLLDLERYAHRRGAPGVRRIVLAGYSRGGAIAIRVARELGAHNHKVHCLLLFDAVDMSLAIAARQIPANVRYCFHAMRDPASRSRTSWGNCGLEREVKNDDVTYFRWLRFMCTHGGMGGVPWTEADPDGIINEAYTGRRLAENLDRSRKLYAGTAGRYTPFGSPGGGGALDAIGALNDWHRSSSRTTISLQQDRRGSDEVRNWMFNRLHWALKQADEPVAVG